MVENPGVVLSTQADEEAASVPVLSSGAKKDEKHRFISIRKMWRNFPMQITTISQILRSS